MPETSTGWKGIAERAKGQIARVREENRETIRAATDTIEVWGGSFGMGYLHGRKGGMPKIANIPYDLGLALISKVVAFAGWAGSYGADAHALGNGFGAYYTGSVGAQMGQKSRDKAGELTGTLSTQEEGNKQSPALDIRTITSGLEGMRYMGAGSHAAHARGRAPVSVGLY